MPARLWYMEQAARELPMCESHRRASMLFENIEVWYNRQRHHSALGYLSPAEFE